MIKISTIRRMLSIRRETKRRGGLEVRREEREKRILGIKQKKIDIIESLRNSWNIGEIKPPTDNEKTLFYLYYRPKQNQESLKEFRLPKDLTWDYLLGIQRKYWG